MSEEEKTGFCMLRCRQEIKGLVSIDGSRRWCDVVRLKSREVVAFFDQSMSVNVKLGFRGCACLYYICKYTNVLVVYYVILMYTISVL